MYSSTSSVNRVIQIPMQPIPNMYLSNMLYAVIRLPSSLFQKQITYRLIVQFVLTFTVLPLFQLYDSLFYSFAVIPVIPLFILQFCRYSSYTTLYFVLDIRIQYILYEPFEILSLSQLYNKTFFCVRDIRNVTAVLLDVNVQTSPILWLLHSWVVEHVGQMMLQKYQQ